MSSAPQFVSRSRSKPRRLVAFGLMVAVAAVSFAIVTAVRVVHAAGGDDIRSADAIVVFGAAEYAGRPSPVYRARLDHAYELYSRGAAPVVITTGGQADDPHFSEGGVGRDYLISRGIPDKHLIAETLGADTAQSAQRVAVILRVNQMHTVLAVSDAYHIFRIKRLMAKEGVVAYGAPRPASWPRSSWGRVNAVARETLSYALWRLHLN
jgi:uncharacterized SAM-binding protein YcdF (DUF218 family)